MMVVVFRSRLREGVDPELYAARAGELLRWAQEMPGFLAVKDFAARDGERVAIVEFEDAESLEAWRTHAGHLVAQRQGREEFYLDYSLQVCELVRESSFEQPV